MSDRTRSGALAPVAQALQFLYELVTLGALAWWGATAGGTTATAIALAIVAPAAAAVVWGLFGAPRGRLHLRGGGRLALEAVFFGAGALALAGAGHTVLGIVFAALAAVNVALLRSLGLE